MASPRHGILSSRASRHERDFLIGKIVGWYNLGRDLGGIFIKRPTQGSTSQPKKKDLTREVYFYHKMGHYAS